MALLARFFQERPFFSSPRSLSLKAIARTSTSVVALAPKEVLPFSAIPGPKGTIRNLLDYGMSRGTFFEVLEKRFDKYGPIYSEKLLDTRIVSISDVDATTNVLRREKNFQMRPGFEAVADIVEETGSSLGLASNDYEIWYPDRSLLSPKMLRPKDVSERYSLLNTIANEFAERAARRIGSDGVVNNIEEELNFWTVESLAAFLFNQRLGFYDDPPDPEAVAFVNSARIMLDMTGKMLHGAPFYKYFKTSTYSMLKESVIEVNTRGLNILNRVLATKQEKVKTVSGHKQSLFEFLSANDKSPERMASMLVGLMSAGIDSTSATCLWLFYELARNPDIQEKLYSELLSSIGPDREVSASKIPSYLKAVVKESQRLYPVAGYVVPRVFHNDIDVLGYKIPAGVKIYSYEFLHSIDERYYGADAKQFVPERWMRDDAGKKREFNPFTMLPFGFGVRMCIGRRMAEALIYTVTSKLLLRYRLEYAGECELKRSLVGTFMSPDQPVLLKLIPREKEI
ncbi:cytochrome P450 10-like [Dendronephthya gigantea]|uniref:cytochrome P450 10-like n=1 Tax=Dendronephthya gigantea TaxID=151771 RepID=UPI00106C8267|nr:cytochrome P450 10-like [Dendronephthya gigantea]